MVVDLLWPSCCVACGVYHRGRICPACLPGGLHRVPVELEGIRGAWALCGYDQPAGRVIRRAKYTPDRTLMVELARPFGERLAPIAVHFDAVVPAPSSVRNVATRGFSSAAILADAVSRDLAIPVIDALRRAPSSKQAALSARGRRRNLAGAIRSRREVKGRVLLVDDVVTTGATAEACARELLGYSATEVWLAVVCATRTKKDVQIL